MKCQTENTRFEKIASVLSDAVVITDSEGRITWTNSAFHKLCGHSRKEVMGEKPGHILQGPSTDPEAVAALHNAVKNGQYHRTEVINYHKNGHPYWVSLSITPIRDDSGTLTSFVGIGRDITDSRVHSESLEQQVVEIYGTLINIEKNGIEAYSQTADAELLSCGDRAGKN